MRIVLASTSRYRGALLERLGLAFEVVAPGVDETPRPGEAPAALAARLAAEKARSVAAGQSDALVIGADQIAVLEGEILGKPGGAKANRRQLERASGRRVEFFTGLALVDARSGREHVDVVPYAVQFRALSPAQIDAYVRRERAYDCAGGFRCEGLGIALFERLEGPDPSALVGLPLVRLVGMLAEEGVDVLLDPRPEESELGR